jgi:hypothetical protein
VTHFLNSTPGRVHLLPIVLLTAFQLSGCTAEQEEVTHIQDCRTLGCENDGWQCKGREGQLWSCVEPDHDEDGVPASMDCDDNDDTIFPGAEDFCDLVDRDCDGQELPDFCKAWYGPTYRITIVSGESLYRWDDGVLGISPSDPDLWVEYGKVQGNFNPGNCRTAEVSDAKRADWNEYCEFTFEVDSTFKIDLRDQDDVGAERVAGWRWTDPKSLTEFLSQEPGEYTLIKNGEDPKSWVRYRIEKI